MHIEHNMDNVVDLRVHIAPEDMRGPNMIPEALAFFGGIYCERKRAIIFVRRKEMLCVWQVNWY